LGNAAKFDFYVATITLVDNSVDYAPDAQDQVFVYALMAPRPTQLLYAFSPKVPKAGKTFSVAVLLVKLDDGTLAVFPTLTCNGTLNGKPIRGTAKTVQCVWKLPRSAKGKRLVVSVTVSNHGSNGTFGPWKFKVR
jgi:hypothetical protein